METGKIQKIIVLSPESLTIIFPTPQAATLFYGSALLSSLLFP